MKRLSVGTILADKLNEYIVRDYESTNTHSQYPSRYLVECYSGPNTGKIRWIGSNLAQDYVKHET